MRELDMDDEYVAATRALVDEFPDSSWSEEALNNLGTHYILTNEDELAAKAFRELYEKFPSGIRAERAAWKYGLVSVQDRRLSPRRSGCSRAPRRRSTARTTGRRSSTGRRVRTASSATAPQADERLRLVQTDYGNSYYGRLASVKLRRESRRASTPYPVEQADGGESPPTASALPTERLIRLLLAGGLYDDAINELRFAQRAWGPSTPR